MWSRVHVTTVGEREREGETGGGNILLWRYECRVWDGRRVCEERKEKKVKKEE